MSQRASAGKISPKDAAETKIRRILALDYGRKRIGLAISDEMGLIAKPLSTLTRTNRSNDFRRLRDICRARGVVRIIVGNPLHMTGEASPLSDEASRFAARLKKELGIPVELQDERLTSWEAEQTMAETKPLSRRRRGSLDDVAAAILLRDYLGQKRGHGRIAAVEKD